MPGATLGPATGNSQKTDPETWVGSRNQKPSSVQQPALPPYWRLADKGRGICRVRQYLDWEAPTREYRHLDILSAPGRTGSFQWHDLDPQLGDTSVAGVVSFGRRNAFQGLPECPLSGGAKKVAEICRHANDSLLPRIDSSLSSDDGRSSEPSPQHDRSCPALCDPTRAASGQKSSD